VNQQRGESLLAGHTSSAQQPVHPTSGQAVPFPRRGSGRPTPRAVAPRRTQSGIPPQPASGLGCHHPVGWAPGSRARHESALGAASPVDPSSRTRRIPLAGRRPGQRNRPQPWGISLA
jgi:hypothetical protein